MFDYNLLGKGYVYSDIRNVCPSLGEKNSFPSWAQSELEKVKNGELPDVLHVLLENEDEKCPTE